MRILIIEDDIETQRALAACLKSACFAVDTADTGDKGLYLAQTNDYDLVISDYVLPEKNGLEICETLRAEGKTMPILILSVKGETPTKVEILNRGADDYLTKPYSFDELLARVQALLRRPKTIASSIITVGDITIDSAQQTVANGKKNLQLTRKEFSLLEYLARVQGTVVSRSTIMEHVWDIEGDVFSNTIEAHILNLRKKLATITKRKLIHTVSGRGYKLDGSH
ncbi:MAG: response regulator transcription factor [Candidatus Buchananbacteria bacterium]|nr:response regulator transcription factor [Candidatus Buchananbacteria bacterium]